MEQINLDEFGIIKDNTNSSILFIPYENILGNIIDFHKKVRCKIIYSHYSKELVGGYGIINFGKRIEKDSIVECTIKRSIDISFNVLNEAIIQHKSYNILKDYNLEYMISKVFDIYKKNDNIYFSMLTIKGDYLHAFLVKSSNSEKDFIYCFLQISLALYILEKHIILEHRDLRFANIFVVKEPKHIQFTLDDTLYSFHSNFHICILDFGFACLGTKPPELYASEELFNKNERCFKPGRDIFQLLISLLSLESIKKKFNNIFYNKLASLLQNDKNDYRNLLSSKKKADLSYIATNYEDFSFNTLSPENFIKILFDLLNYIT